MTITHRAAVLGDPIAHSLSPVLHNAAYEALGLSDWHYGRARVSEDGLVEFLHGLDDSWRGLSLTMPLKRTIIPFGKPADRWVKLLGVSNTAVFDWSKPNDADTHMPAITLHNTDVHGIVGALTDACDTTDNLPTHGDAQTALVIGNGNTARSAVAALSSMGVRRIDVAARHEAKTTPLIELGEQLDVTVTPILLDAVAERAANYGFTISTLPAHAADPIAVSLVAAHPATHPADHPTGEAGLGTLLDVIYDPRPTQLMQTWEALGGTAVGGQEMLLRQAVPQVAFMTGIDVHDVQSRAFEAMRAALYAAL